MHPMSQAHTFTLDEHQLAFVGKLLDRQPTSISPLQSLDTPEPSADAISQLKGAKILDRAGQPTPEVRDALTILARANSFCRLRYIRGEHTLEHHVYSQENQRVALLTTQSAIEVSHPAPISDLLAAHAVLMGESELKSSAFQAQLSASEALTLAALIDLVRKAIASNLTSEIPANSLAFTHPQIEEELSDPNDRVQRMVSVMRKRFSSGPHEIDIPHVQPDFNGLIRQNLCSLDGNRIRPSELVIDLCQAFLRIEQFLTLTQGTEHPDGVYLSSFLCLQGGPHDYLLIENTAESVTLQCLSGRELSGMVRLALNRNLNPAPEDTPAPTPVHHPQTPASPQTNLPPQNRTSEKLSSNAPPSRIPSVLLVLLSALILVGVGGGAYFYFFVFKAQQLEIQNLQARQTSVADSEALPAESKVPVEPAPATSASPPPPSGSIMDLVEQYAAKAAQPVAPPTPKVVSLKERIESQPALEIVLGHGEVMEFVGVPHMQCWIGKYEVSNKQFRAFAPSHNSGIKDGQDLNTDPQPVVNISFDQVEAYLRWFNQNHLAGKNLTARLPTQNEFIRMLECGDNRIYPWGDNFPPNPIATGLNYGQRATRGSFSDNNEVHPLNDRFAVSASVYASGLNPWGIYGAGGNVREWSQDPDTQTIYHGGGSYACEYEFLMRCQSVLSSPDPVRARKGDSATGFRIFVFPQ
jgi:hypothetical protein